MQFRCKFYREYETDWCVDRARSPIHISRPVRWCWCWHTIRRCARTAPRIKGSPMAPTGFTAVQCLRPWTVGGGDVRGELRRTDCYDCATGLVACGRAGCSGRCAAAWRGSANVRKSGSLLGCATKFCVLGCVRSGGVCQKYDIPPALLGVCACVLIRECTHEEKYVYK